MASKAMSDGGDRETNGEAGGGTGTPPENHWMPDFHLLWAPRIFSNLEPRAPQGSWLRKHRVNRRLSRLP